MPIRSARPSDLDLSALVAIENESFADDRLSRRSLRYFLAVPNAIFIVFDMKGSILGHGLVVALRKGLPFRRGFISSVCHAVRGRDFGQALLRSDEAAARQYGASVMRLEVHGQPPGDRALSAARLPMLWPDRRLLCRRGVGAALREAAHPDYSKETNRHG